LPSSIDNRPHTADVTTGEVRFHVRKKSDPDRSARSPKLVTGFELTAGLLAIDGNLE
jgi:hypothetical protein